MSEKAEFTEAVIIGGGMTGRKIDLFGKNPASMLMLDANNNKRLFRPKTWVSKDGRNTLLLVADDVSDDQISGLVDQIGFRL